MVPPPARPFGLSSSSLPLRRLVLQFRQQHQVALPAIPRDAPGLDALAHPAPGLGPVAAVGVAAVVQERPKLWKAGVELSGFDPPQADLAEPGRVHQVAAAREREHDGRDRRVAAASNLGADVRGAKLESRLNPVEETRLAGPRRASDP